MNYCERCKAFFEEEICPVCNSRKVREIRPSDYCYLTKGSRREIEILQNSYDNLSIPNQVLPYGSEINAKFGLPAQTLQIFVPFKYYEKACDVFNQIFGDKTEDYRKDLLDNLEKLNIAGKTAKKITKKLKLQDKNIFDFIVHMIENSTKIYDGGEITGVFKDDNGEFISPRYIMVICENKVLSINSITYEIISVDKI